MKKSAADPTTPSHPIEASLTSTAATNSDPSRITGTNQWVLFQGCDGATRTKFGTMNHSHIGIDPNITAGGSVPFHNWATSISGRNNPALRHQNSNRLSESTE